MQQQDGSIGCIGEDSEAREAREGQGGQGGQGGRSGKDSGADSGEGTAANLPTRSDEVTAPAGDMHLGMKAYIEELEAKVAAWAWDFRRRPLPGALTAGHKEDEYASVLPGVT
jgi:hypothetical protein